MFEALNRIRVLPLTIFVGALLLTLKIGTIWQGVDGLFEPSLSISTASAQQAEGGAGLSDAPPVTAPQDGAPATAEGGQAGDAAAEPPVDPAAEQRLLADDPTLMTQNEIDLLQQLAERREALDARAQEMEQRSALLTAAEARIDRKIVELQDLKGIIEELIKDYDEQQLAKVNSLVKIYENMKPKDAARIFEELEMDTLLMVAERMKERKLAPVMANMNPAKARDVTVELSRLRELPQPVGAPGGAGG